MRHEVLSEMSVMLQSAIQANLTPLFDQVRMVQATMLSFTLGKAGGGALGREVW